MWAHLNMYASIVFQWYKELFKAMNFDPCNRALKTRESIGTPALNMGVVTTPLWDKCEGETHTPKSGKLKSSGTPKNLEFDFRGEISSHSSVLYVIGKVLKCRCPKWPRMSHFNICSPSYGQKKGLESTFSRRL
jgi:hypothetical protein